MAIPRLTLGFREFLPVDDSRVVAVVLAEAKVLELDEPEVALVVAGTETEIDVAVERADRIALGELDAEVEVGSNIDAGAEEDEVESPTLMPQASESPR